LSTDIAMLRTVLEYSMLLPGSHYAKSEAGKDQAT
jgi:hypothetical protein